MTLESTNRFLLDRLTLSAERRIDALCLQFEAAWQSGQAARMEDFIRADAVESERCALVLELMRLEWEYRLARDETPAVAEYAQRFPQYADAIASWHSARHVYESAAQATARPLPNVPGYELLRELGRGGMGIVYQARQTRANRIVALKCIRTERPSPHEVERFHREVQAVAALDHAGIVPIYDVGEHEGTHYFTMKFIPGHSLDHVVKAGPVASRRAAQWMSAIARAIHYAHERGILHRDLKPANVLVDQADLPHVTDFGLARRLDGEPGATISGVIVGTPGYMAPEQAEGASNWTPRTDVYGLGAILYALLTGRPPFHAATAMETIRQVSQTKPAPPRLLNPQVDRDLETICLKCMAKDPRNRYASAAALADELDRYLAGGTIEARPPGWVDAIADQIEGRYFVDPKTWSSINLWGAAIVCTGHLSIYWLVNTAQERWAFWLMYLLATLGIWTIYRHYLARRKVPFTPSERHILVLSAAFQIGSFVIWYQAGAPLDENLWAVYPTWAVLMGIFLFVQGSLYWGRFYLIGAAWFGLALAMKLKPGWSPIGVSLLYGITMLFTSWYLRRVQGIGDAKVS